MFKKKKINKINPPSNTRTHSSLYNLICPSISNTAACWLMTTHQNKHAIFSPLQEWRSVPLCLMQSLCCWLNSKRTFLNKLEWCMTEFFLFGKFYFRGECLDFKMKFTLFKTFFFPPWMIWKKKKRESYENKALRKKKCFGTCLFIDEILSGDNNQQHVTSSHSHRSV